MLVGHQTFLFITLIVMIGEAHNVAVVYGHNLAIINCKHQVLEVSFKATQDSVMVKGLQESSIVCLVKTQLFIHIFGHQRIC